MSEEGEIKKTRPRPAARRTRIKRRQSKRALSMFFPVLLIAAGTVLLFVALGLVSTLNWEAALRLWPLLLIFIGLDLIVRAFPSPGGTLLSLLVGLIAAGILVYVLLYANQVSFLAKTIGRSDSDLKKETVEYPLEGVTAADISLDLGQFGAAIDTLNDSRNLIEAEVIYSGDLIFDAETTDGQATIELAADAETDWIYWINPVNWFDQIDSQRWNIGLSPSTPANLNLDLGSGSVDLSLNDLTLSALNVRGASGHVDLELPDGDYDMTYDVGSGSVYITLPQEGRHQFLVAGGSGGLDITVPASMEVRIIVQDKGSGGLSIDESVFRQTEVGDDGQGIWVTENYFDSTNQVELILDTGSGSVEIEG